MNGKGGMIREVGWVRSKAKRQPTMIITIAGMSRFERAKSGGLLREPTLRGRIPVFAGA